MEKGSTITLDKVLFIGDGSRVAIGTPVIEGAKVVATWQREGKGKKVIVFRYKSKVHYRKKTGHRQAYIRLTIDKIISPEVISGEPEASGGKEEVIGSDT